MWNDFWLKVNNWHSRYERTTDADGVVWLHDRNDPLCSKPIKAHDPNFVQGKVPTPKFTIGTRSFDTLNVIAAVIILICALLLLGAVI